MAHRRYGRFTPEFREEALRRVAETGKPIVQVAEELGVDHRTLWGWVNAAKLERIDPAGELTAEARKRIRDLEKENALLRRDLEFQKKAQAFFRELDQQKKNDSR
jgi:transposase-like protein